jgi:hypothetical protein
MKRRLRTPVTACQLPFSQKWEKGRRPQVAGMRANADTLIPDPGDPVSYDRYAYTRNNPVRYTDPSGHLVCSDPNVAEGDCSDEGAGAWRYGVKFEGNWTERNRRAAREALYAVGKKYSEILGGDPWDAFGSVFSDGITFAWVDSYEYQGKTYISGAVTRSSSRIEFASLTVAVGNRTEEVAFISARNNVVHELAHAFANRWDYEETSGPYATGIPIKYQNNDGFYPSPPSTERTWRQHPCTYTTNPNCGHEVFADQFLGWTFGMWDDSKMGTWRRDYMSLYMPIWLAP